MKSISSSTPSVCTVSGLVARYVGVGRCTLTAHVAAGVDYGSGTGSPQSFTVVKATTTTKSIPSNRTIYLGQAGNDRAIVTGNAGGGSPTGSVKFYECGMKSAPTRCTSTAHEVHGAVSLDAGANHTSSQRRHPSTRPRSGTGASLLAIRVAPTTWQALTPRSTNASTSFTDRT